MAWLWLCSTSRAKSQQIPLRSSVSPSAFTADLSNNAEHHLLTLLHYAEVSEGYSAIVGASFIVCVAVCLQTKYVRGHESILTVTQMAKMLAAKVLDMSEDTAPQLMFDVSAPWSILALTSAPPRELRRSHVRGP